ncbi:MAG: DUF1566 domain-containing protein [Candidatus Polarisedimenticolia bacterium]
MRIRVMVALAVLGLLAAEVGAGNLDPSGPPGPTMKTLDEIPPTWSFLIAGASRFRPALSGGSAFLDKETGLVWQKVPSSGSWSWSVAQGFCLAQPIGSRLGWRLPTAEEMFSLIDPTQTGAPFLPTGHPFGTIEGVFWTSTTNANNTAGALGVDFSAGIFPLISTDISKTSGTAKVWCVRGGYGYEAR